MSWQKLYGKSKCDNQARIMDNQNNSTFSFFSQNHRTKPKQKDSNLTMKLAETKKEDNRN